MRIAVCQTNPTIGHFERNLSLIRRALERARTAHCSLAVFPEMSLSGYPPRDLLDKPGFIEANLKHLDRLASSVQGIHALCGYVDRNPKRTGQPLVNAVALIGEGRVLKRGAKRLLPSYDVFDETRYFEPVPESLAFEMEGRVLGVTICEDIWKALDAEGVPQYEVNPVSDLMEKGVRILINISASPYTLRKGLLRMKMLRDLTTRYKVPAIYCNQVGGNDELLFDGGSMVVDSGGRLILLGRRFEPDLLIWDDGQEYEELNDPWPTQEEETILKGLVMGTRDYVLKCGFRKGLIGLSGGIDSSLVAVIAKEALGAENVLGVSMPSPYTSRLSRENARALAARLGISFEEIPIHEIFQGFKESLAPLFKGLEEDQTEENLQSRIRGTLLMALSNKFDALLLATGNKSELATDYCTLYGDMCGALAVISDIPKTMCYRLAAFINRDQEIIPQEVISRPPSAELKPNQTDQDTLPPYEAMDRVLEASVERNLSADEIVAQGNDPAVVRDVLRRLALNEYKRRQAPPGLKITTKAFGYGRRYPIARGGDPY